MRCMVRYTSTARRAVARFKCLPLMCFRLSPVNSITADPAIPETCSALFYHAPETQQPKASPINSRYPGIHVRFIPTILSVGTVVPLFHLRLQVHVYYPFLPSQVLHCPYPARNPCLKPLSRAFCFLHLQALLSSECMVLRSHWISFVLLEPPPWLFFGVYVRTKCPSQLIDRQRLEGQR